MLTPPLWTTHRPRWLPWYLESYINGVHTFNKPQPWLFPLFPWAAFACAGLAIGFLLFSPWSARHHLATVSAIGAAGAALCAAGWRLDAQPRQLYAVYDFWHTSPNFFLLRLGVLMGIILASYLWCRWGAGQWGFSPLIELGQSSLVVYWVHIEFVYGRLSILRKGAQGILSATVGLLIIFVAMTLLAYARNRAKGKSLRQLISHLRSSHATQ
jgi:fucose 4-O-acetylase-like acetyltransferase